MNSADCLDLESGLVDKNASIIEFAQRFIAHFSNELAQGCADEVAQIIQGKDDQGHLTKHQAVSRDLYEQLQWDRYVKIGYLEQFWRAQFPNSFVELKEAS